MNKFLTSILLILCCYSGVKGSHLIGGEITYKCLGGNQYRLILTLYRDCGGISMQPTATINYFSSCDTTVQSSVLSPIDLNPDDPTTVGILDYTYICYNFITTNQTTCNGGYFPGMETFRFESVVTLPPCAEWTFSFQQCCRNTTLNYTKLNDCSQGHIITTGTNNPSGQWTTLVSTLNNSDGQCNDSPEFLYPPRTTICQTQEVIFDNAAFDADGDQVSYKIVSPIQSMAPNDTVIYNPGFNGQRPISLEPGSTFNIENDGSITCFPKYLGAKCSDQDTVEQSTMAIVVEQYRNGTLVGSVLRDYQIISLPQCEELIPVQSFSIASLDSSLMLNDSTVAACSGDTVTLNIDAVNDEHPSDSWAWYADSCGGAIVDTGHSIQIVPTSNATYFVKSIGSCIGSGSCTSINIEVQEVMVNAGEDISKKEDENITLDGETDGLTYYWQPSEHLNDSTSLTPSSSTNETTDYILTATNNICSNSDTVRLTVDGSYLEIRNIITPNDDGKNDFWRVNDPSLLDNCSVTILNRWGNTVYHSNSGYDNNWDGTSNGNKLPDGSYFYLIKCENQEYKGTITILNSKK